MKRLTGILCGIVFVCSAGIAAAQPKVVAEANATTNVRLEVGETRLVHVSEKIIRVSVADPNVADIQVVTPLQILITAKQVGYTHVIMWGSSDQPLVIGVSATRNLDQLRNQIEHLFPGEQIEVGAAGDLVVLSGHVSDLRLPQRAAEIARLYSKQLANLVEVSGNQQVQLEVRFAEVSRSGLRRLGFNMLYRDGARSIVAGVTSNATNPGQYMVDPTRAYIPGTGAGGPPVVSTAGTGGAFNWFFSTGLSSFPFSAILSILSQEGLAKVLAEPTLVAMSGQEADFHAGGEVPILIAQQLGQVGVSFKKFGVRLHFVPTVLGEGHISLKLRVEVSEPDPAAGVTLGGYTIPGFKTRTNETTVQLDNGQSFAVAGLLSDQIRNTVAKVPLLGDIPILGMLFRSTQFQREETELMVVVEAHLVKPLDEGVAPALPGEFDVNDPSDFDLFLLGRLAGDTDDDDDDDDDNNKASQDPATPAPVPGPAPADSQAPGARPDGPIGYMRDF